MTMMRCLKTFQLLVLVVVLSGLSACSCGDREDRLAKIRGSHGKDAVGGGVTQVVQLSPGAQLYRDKTCHTCHGDDGTKPLLPNYPVIARQAGPYALQQMKDIQSGGRVNGQSAAMKAVVQDLTEEDMILLADYIENELGADAQVGTGEVDPESEGAKLFKTKTCTACHGVDAKTPLLPDYPRIAGHNAEYALAQMKDIKSGARANSMAVLGMKGIMHLVTEEEMAQLAEYIATMPR
jgi:cytochrome c553